MQAYDTKIAQQQTTIQVEKQVARLDVTMYYTHAMSIIQCICHLTYIAGDNIEIKVRAIAFHLINTLSQCATSNKGHDQIGQLLMIYNGFFILVDWQDVLMLLFRYRIGLAAKAFQEN